MGQCGSRCRASLIAIACAAALALFVTPVNLLCAQNQMLPSGYQLEQMMGGLENPVAFDFAPDGRVFVGERTSGRILVIEGGALLAEPFATVPVAASGQRGLLGLALAPDFAETRHVYVFHSYTPREQRITRFTADGNRGTAETIILDEIPASALNNGGRIGFGPDGMLYFTVGDNDQPALARDPSFLSGKLHRVSPAGGVPTDNPWPRSTAFCVGLRNSFGFTFHPDLMPVAVYLADNGTTVCDEVHLVTAGADCGWPAALGMGGRPPCVDPIYSWSPTTAPVGIVYYRGDNFPLQANGDLFVAEYNTGRIVRLHLDGDGNEVLGGAEVFFEGNLGHLYALELADDGTLWFAIADGLYRISCLQPPQKFVRGDADGRDGVTLHDAATLILQLRSDRRGGCQAALDVNDDGRVNLADVSTLLGFIHGVVPSLPAPFPACGVDHTSELDCLESATCE